MQDSIDAFTYRDGVFDEDFTQYYQRFSFQWDKLDYQSAARWEKRVGSGGMHLEFDLKRQPGQPAADEDTKLFIRALLPFSRVNYCKKGSQYAEKVTYVEIERAITLPAKTPTDASCKLKLSGVLDDHYNSTGQYKLAVYVNGTLVHTEQKTPFVHGQPHSQIFKNWEPLEIDLGSVSPGDTLEVKLNHTGSSGGDWIGSRL
jgi:hypothetical protein